MLYAKMANRIHVPLHFDRRRARGPLHRIINRAKLLLLPEHYARRKSNLRVPDVLPFEICEQLPRNQRIILRRANALDHPAETLEETGKITETVSRADFVLG